MILAVLFGLGLTSLLYMGINEGLKPVFGQATNISKYMPDVVMSETPLDTLKALAVAIVTGGVFLLPVLIMAKLLRKGRLLSFSLIQKLPG